MPAICFGGQMKPKQDFAAKPTHKENINKLWHQK